MPGSNGKNIFTTRYALEQKMHVIQAVVLRDMRTRFFNHGLGFLVVALWPLCHMGILLLIYNLAGRKAPFGESMNIFFATGLIPTLAFMYISRFMSLSLIINRPMLSFPAVKVIDVLTARAFLEIIAAAITLTFMFFILWSIGENPFPYDPIEAIYAYLATILLAIGIGTLAGVIVMFVEIFVTIYALAMILIYISSGTLFVASSLPDIIAIPLSWNPVTECVEWMRTAYFETYSNRLVSKEYVVCFGMASLCLGLLLERLFRLRMLES